MVLTGQLAVGPGHIGRGETAGEGQPKPAAIDHRFMVG
jgi:hypothetical protein